MDNKTRENIQARYELISALTLNLHKKINESPDGRIKIRKVRGYISYYRSFDRDGKDIYLGKDEMELVEALLQKSYFEHVLKASEAEAGYLKKMLEGYPDPIAEDVYDLLTEERQQHVRPIILPDDQFIRQWEEKPFEHKPFKEGAPYYETIRGERVRSKSEQIIADRLHAKKIPYRYECPLKVGKDIIHPDFTILRMSDRKELYVEHCGKMDDPGYSQDMVIRMNRYALAGIHQGEKLFLTYESSSSPFDVRVLDRMIEDLFR